MRWVVWLGALMVMVTATMAAAQTPSPALLVVLRPDKAEAMLGIVDPVAGKIVARVPLGPDSAGVAVSADGKLAYVANTNGHGRTVPDGDSISVIDLAARKEVRRVAAGNGTRPHEVHVAGGRVYFTAEGYKAIGRYDPAGNRVEYFGLGQGGPHMIAISKDLNTIYGANHGTNNVTVLEGAREGPASTSASVTSPSWKITVIPVGNTPEGIDISPDGKEVWTANEEGGGVSIIDVATKVAQNVDLQTKHANRLRITPDGRLVLLLDRETGEMVAVDARTRKVVKRLTLPGDKPGETMGVGDFVVVPDSSRVYVSVSSRGGHHYIAAIDLKTLEVTRRIETDSRPNALAWVETK